MRLRLSGCRIGVVADVGFGQQVADRVVGEGFRERVPARGERGGGQPVERIVGEGLADVIVGVRAAEQVAEAVVAVGEVRMFRINS